MSPSTVPSWWPAAASLLTLGCSGAQVDDARQAWLVDRLIQDNAVYLGRDPDLLAAKFDRMAAHPYDWVRGSAGVWGADQARPASGRVPTAFADDPSTCQVLLAGDPHPENLGTFLPGPGPGPDQEADAPASDGLRLELNDLDGAAWGPWVLDLRRAALGLAVLAQGLDGCDEACQQDAVRALAAAYFDVATGLDTAPTCTLEACDRGPTGGDPGHLVWDLLEEADEEGRERKRLDKYTQLDAEGLRDLRVDAALDDAGEGVLALTADEAGQVDRLAGALTAAEGGGIRVLDAARRFGAGVSSLPAIRYVLLVDRGDDGPDDDDLLNLREVLDPPTLPGLVGTVPGLFDSQADRAERAPRLLWSTPQADAAHHGLSDGAQTFKLTTWSSWFQGFEREKIEEAWTDGDAAQEDLDGLAAVLGATLAAAHGRAPTASGALPAAAVAAELEGRRDELIEETVQATRADLAQALVDQALLQDALLRYGPLLGADEQGAGVGP